MSNDYQANNSQNGDLIEERRKFIRLNINVEIKYAVVSDKSAERTAQTRDIGAGGICILADEPLKKGDVLDINFLLPEVPPNVHAKGRVAWIKPFSIASEQNIRYDTGIEFIDITDEDRKRVNKYVFSLKLPK